MLSWLEFKRIWGGSRVGGDDSWPDISPTWLYLEMIMRESNKFFSGRGFETEREKDRVLTAGRGVRSQLFSPGSAPLNETF